MTFPRPPTPSFGDGSWPPLPPRGMDGDAAHWEEEEVRRRDGGAAASDVAAGRRRPRAPPPS